MDHVLSQVQAPAIATSMMASLYGAVRTWDDSFTLTDLFGYSGHAFILNIERTLCPSGPTAWDWGAILFPLRQLFSLRRLCASCDMRDANEARELIWQRALESIDDGRPVILWDVLYPEFYLAYGYDAAAGEYLVQGPGTGRCGGRASWERLGCHTGSVWALYPAPHETPNRPAARDLALRGALNWHRWPNEAHAQWTFGGDAWNVWIDAMRDEDLALASDALSYNQYVYAECRRHATLFLQNLGSDYAEAAGHYARVADLLDEVGAAWPFPAPPPSLDVRRGLAETLTAARDAEDEAVRALDALRTPAHTAAR